MSSKVFTAIKVSFNDSLTASNKVQLMGRINRWCDSHAGRVISTLDDSFIFTDLEGEKLSGLLHVLEVGGAIPSLRLVSMVFFDKLFAGEVAA